MAMRIRTKKLVWRGEKARKITGMGGIMESEELPLEYLKGNPRVEWISDKWGGLAIYTDDGKRLRLLINEIYTEAEFQVRLEWIEKAGERLYRIRQKEKELKESWKGEETFII